MARSSLTWRWLGRGSRLGEGRGECRVKCRGEEKGGKVHNSGLDKCGGGEREGDARCGEASELGEPVHQGTAVPQRGRASSNTTVLTEPSLTDCPGSHI